MCGATATLSGNVWSQAFAPVEASDRIVKKPSTNRPIPAEITIAAPGPSSLSARFRGRALGRCRRRDGREGSWVLSLRYS